MRKHFAILLLASVAACGGGGGSNGDQTGVITPTPTPPPPTPTPTPPPPTPTPTPTPPLRPAGLYSVAPDLAACRAGQLAGTTRDQVLQTVNTIRALHRLPQVTYSVADEPEAMEAALIMAANRQLSHTPSTSWRCYTGLGAEGAASSNLFGGVSSPNLPYFTNDSILIGWMTDVNNLVADNVGHRRWMLDPFLTTVSYGRVIGQDGNSISDAAALKVFDFANPSALTGALPDYVAYPFEDYPARFFDTSALLSFGAIPNKTSKFGNQNVNYSGATVTVRQRGGGTMSVSAVSYDTLGYGLPNNIQFRVAGLQQNIIYDVTIANVQVNGAPRTYNYWFRIVP